MGCEFSGLIRSAGRQEPYEQQEGDGTTSQSHQGHPSVFGTQCVGLGPRQTVREGSEKQPDPEPRSPRATKSGEG